jgi:tRNA threonylcarbamoyladenosine biosynthesis protein TsaB
VRRALALDTSSRWGNVAVVAQERSDLPPSTIAELGERVEHSHSAVLLGLIERVLARAGCSKSAIDLFVATRGPGSFTGVRIALGTVRGLGLATERPCAGVTTLEAIAEAYGQAELSRVPLLPAGRGELYGATYSAVGFPPVEIEPPWLGPPERAFETGPALLLLAGDLKPLEPPSGADAVSQRAAPANIAGAAGRIALSRGEPSDLAPLYIRPPDALLHPRS